MVEEDAVFPLKFSKLGCSEPRCIVTFNRYYLLYILKYIIIRDVNRDIFSRRLIV